MTGGRIGYPVGDHHVRTTLRKNPDVLKWALAGLATDHEVFDLVWTLDRVGQGHEARALVDARADIRIEHRRLRPGQRSQMRCERGKHLRRVPVTAQPLFSDLPGGGPTQSPPLPQPPSLSVPGIGDPLLSVERKHIFFVSDLAGIIRGLTVNVSVLTLLTLGLFVASWWILWKTAFGLRLRSVGESPAAAESLGVNVYRYKFIGVLVSGGLAGLGGAFLTLVASNLFRDGQTGGRGYIGLAAMIFGNWRPGGLLAGSALFGYTDAIRLRGGGGVHAILLLVAVLLLLVGLWQLRKGRTLPGAASLVLSGLVAWWYFATDTVPGELAGTLPYMTTLLVLAFASQRLRMPAADGQIYRKGGH